MSVAMPAGTPCLIAASMCASSTSATYAGVTPVVAVAAPRIRSETTNTCPTRSNSGRASSAQSFSARIVTPWRISTGVLGIARTTLASG